VMNTAFRNYLLGSDPGRIDATVAVNLFAWNRYFNIVGNVLGTPGYSKIYQTVDFGGSGIIYSLGAGDTEGSVVIPDDPLVAATMMRWGNYDTVNTASRFVASEVPSGLSLYANPVPSSNTLPPSFYLSVKPAWWPAAKPWPPIGPDVSGGNIPNLGGHAYTLPAQDCYSNVMGGPPDGTGGALSFNAAACYGSGSSSACDVNKDGTTNVSDVQLEVNMALGVAPCTNDINTDGSCNVADVQRVVNAALGGQCVTGP